MVAKDAVGVVVRCGGCCSNAIGWERVLLWWVGGGTLCWLMTNHRVCILSRTFSSTLSSLPTGIFDGCCSIGVDAYYKGHISTIRCYCNGMLVTQNALRFVTMRGHTCTKSLPGSSRVSTVGCCRLLQVVAGNLVVLVLVGVGLCTWCFGKCRKKHTGIIGH